MWQMPPMAMGFFFVVCVSSLSLLSFLIVCGHEFINRIRPLFFHSRCLTLLSSLSFSLLLLLLVSTENSIFLLFPFGLRLWDRIDMRDACVDGSSSPLATASTGFWRVDWQGRATLVYPSRWGAKNNSKSQKLYFFFFFKSGAQVSSHFFWFFLRSIWALRKNKQQEGEEKKEEDIFSSFKMLCVAWMCPVCGRPPTEIKTERTKSPHRAMMFVDLVRTQFELYQLSEFLFFCGA